MENSPPAPFYGLSSLTSLWSWHSMTICRLFLSHTSYFTGWVTALTKYGLNRHLSWIIVCKWKLSQIIFLLLAQGRPLSHWLTIAFMHTQLSFYHFYFLGVNLLYNNSLCVLFFSSWLFPVSIFFCTSFTTTLFYRPFTSPRLSLPVPCSKFQGSRKHKHAQDPKGSGSTMIELS